MEEKPKPPGTRAEQEDQPQLPSWCASSLAVQSTHHKLKKACGYLRMLDLMKDPITTTAQDLLVQSQHAQLPLLTAEHPDGLTAAQNQV